MRKLFLVSFMLIGLVINKAHTEVIKSIEVNGNNRISDETILVFSGIKLNNKINSTTDLNNILKELYNTNYFSDVDVDFTENKLVINVIENGYSICATQRNKGKKFKSFT